MKNVSQWNWSMNDADFCNENGMPCQTRLAANESDGGYGNFYSLSISPGNAYQCLSSCFESLARLQLPTTPHMASSFSLFLKVFRCRLLNIVLNLEKLSDASLAEGHV